jgi:hypothetical protein
VKIPPASSTLERLAPWAILGLVAYLVMQQLGKRAKEAGAAVMGAAGQRSESETVKAATVGARAEQGFTASILDPANGGTVARVGGVLGFGGNKYRVRVGINNPAGPRAVVLRYTAKEFYQLDPATVAPVWTETRTLPTGYTVIEFEQAVASASIFGVNVVGVLEIDGAPMATSRYSFA